MAKDSGFGLLALLALVFLMKGKPSTPPEYLVGGGHLPMDEDTQDDTESDAADSTIILTPIQKQLIRHRPRITKRFMRAPPTILKAQMITVRGRDLPAKYRDE